MSNLAKLRKSAYPPKVTVNADVWHPSALFDYGELKLMKAAESTFDIECGDRAILDDRNFRHGLLIPVDPVCDAFPAPGKCALAMSRSSKRSPELPYTTSW